MNTERLEHLITIMHDVTILHKKFDMNSWAIKSPMECGTTCCALGWAALDPKCIAEGLVLQASWALDQYEPDGKFVYAYVLLTNAEAWDKIEDTMREYPVSLIPMYQGNHGFNAAIEYYDISYGQAEYLFDGTSYLGNPDPITPQDVIDHIKQVLKGYDPGDYDEEQDDRNEPDEDSDEDKPTGNVGFV